MSKASTSLGEDRADPFDEAGAQILLDAGERCGGDSLERLDLKLFAVPVVLDPLAGQLEGLAWRDGWQVSYNGGQVAPPRHLEPGHHIVVLFIDISDPLQRPLECVV